MNEVSVLDAGVEATIDSGDTFETPVTESVVTETPEIETLVIDPQVRIQMAGIERDHRKPLGLIAGIPAFQSNDELSSELRREVESYNGDKATVVEGYKKIVGPILASLTRLANPSVVNPPLGDMFAAVDAVKVNRLISLEVACKVAQAGKKLAAKCRAELDAVAAKREAEYAETLDAVKEWLTEGGQGADATDAGFRGTNPGAAERQFHILATWNVRSRKSEAIARDAKNRAVAMRDAVPRCGTCAEEIQAEILRLVSKEVRI